MAKRGNKAAKERAARQALYTQLWLIYEADGQGDWENLNADATELARIVPQVVRIWEMDKLNENGIKKGGALLQPFSLDIWRDPLTLANAMFGRGFRAIVAPSYQR